MATHVFKIYSSRYYSYPAGPYDVDVAYMSEHMPSQPYAFVRDAPVANEDLYIHAMGHYAGQYLFWGTHYMIHRTYLHFTMYPYDLAGASVVSASLFLKLYHVPGDGDFDIVVQRGIAVDGDNTPVVHHIPYDLADYNRTLVDWNGGSVNTSAGVEGSFIEIPLNATGISWLNLTKDIVSKLCIRSSDDIDGIPTPGFDHVCAWDSGNTFTLGNKPYLLIEVTLTDGAITTNDPTNVGLTSARWHGEITDAGYWFDQYGFEYKEGLDGEVRSIRVGWSGYKPKEYDYTKGSLTPATTYYYRAWKLSDVGKIYGDWIMFFTGIGIINVKADNIAGHCILYGEIMDLLGKTVVERGFEYLVQETEPSAEDTGTEVKETKAAGFSIGEYHLSSWDTFHDLYCAPLNTVWWFRAYCKDDGANKYVAETWMKNLPNVITQAVTNINYNKADGNGTVVSQGASELTARGFTVLHEFYGRLPDSWRFEIGGFEGEPEQVVVHDAFGVTVIDIHWEGDLIKTVSQWYALEIGAFSITIGQMVLGWPIMDDCLVEGKDYKCKAFAENEFGRAYGEEVDFSTWARTYFSEDPPTVGEISIVKNEIIENLPVGVTASRRGFRYGTTEAADEFDVHENGSFTNGPYSMMLPDLLPDTTYYIVGYIVVNGIIYEGSMETITTDPEGTEDEDEYPTPHYSPHGQDYREMSTKVFAEVLASQGIIDFSGGKKTLSLVNHLIQTNPNAKTIADNYLDRFKLAKTRMTVTFPTPLPFEREDTVDFSFGELLFKENGQGIAHFKEDGEGVAVLMDQITMIIKKINSVGLTKTEESIEYVAILDLEHE